MKKIKSLILILIPISFISCSQLEGFDEEPIEVWVQNYINAAFQDTRNNPYLSEDFFETYILGILKSDPEIMAIYDLVDLVYDKNYPNGDYLIQIALKYTEFYKYHSVNALQGNKYASIMPMGINKKGQFVSLLLTGTYTPESKAELESSNEFYRIY